LKVRRKGRQGCVDRTLDLALSFTAYLGNESGAVQKRRS
jgi:hypothetical protein